MKTLHTRQLTVGNLKKRYADVLDINTYHRNDFFRFAKNDTGDLVIETVDTENSTAFLADYFVGDNDLPAYLEENDFHSCAKVWAVDEHTGDVLPVIDFLVVNDVYPITREPFQAVVTVVRQ